MAQVQGFGNPLFPGHHHGGPPPGGQGRGGPENGGDQEGPSKGGPPADGGIVDGSGEQDPPAGAGQYRPAEPDSSSSSQVGHGGVTGGQGYIGGADSGSYDGPRVTDDGSAGGNGTGSAGDSDEERERELLEAVKTLLPPDKFVIKARQERENLDRARVQPISTPAKPVTRSIALTLKPHEAIPTIDLEYGVVTTLTFADATGAPWPVKGVITDQTQYGYTGATEGKGSSSNIITIYPKTQFSNGRNIAVMLEGGTMPFIANLKTGDTKDVDYRVDVSILQRGPNAKEEVMTEGLAPTDDRIMDTFIDDIAPAHAVSLHTSSNNVEVWKLREHGQSMYYVRTTLHLLSPGYVRRSHSNISGYAVYCLQETPNIVLSDDSGRLSSVNIGE